MSAGTSAARRLVVAVCAIAVWGCGGSDDGGGSAKLNTQTVARNLQQELNSAGSSSFGSPSSAVNVTSLVCPSEVDKKKGTSFTCQAKGDDGVAGPVNVTLLDDTGNKIQYKAKLKGPGVTSTKSGTVTFSGG